MKKRHTDKWKKKIKKVVLTGLNYTMYLYSIALLLYCLDHDLDFWEKIINQ